MRSDLDTLDFLDDYPEGPLRMRAAISRRDHWRWMANHHYRWAVSDRRYMVLFGAQAVAFLLAVVAVTVVIPWFSPAAVVVIAPVMFAIECHHSAKEHRTESARYWGLVDALDARMNAEREVPA